MTVPNQYPKLRTDNAQQSRVQDNVWGSLTPVLTALNATPIMGARPTWTTTQLLNGYANFGGVSFATAGYYKDSLMRVWSKGTLINSTGAPLGTGTSVMQFPAGLRPSEPQRLTVVGDAATFQFVTVATDGNVYPGIAVPSPGSLDLFFSFLAEL